MSDNLPTSAPAEVRQEKWSRKGWFALPLISLLLAALCLVHRSWPVPLPVIGGSFFIAIVASALIRYYADHVEVEELAPSTLERMLWAFCGLGLVGTQLVQLVIEAPSQTGITFLLIAPLSAMAMLASALVGPQVAMFALTIVAFLLGVTGPIPKEVLATAWISGSIAAHAVNPMRQRADLIRALSVTALAQALIAACATMLTVNTATPVLQSASWAAVSAVITSAIFWLGVTVLERMFGTISDWSLLELCSPEHPLIRELCLRAPGTYAHSVMVANLAEQAARAIGANPIHLRAMAYFHDVGKIERPTFFIENQLGENLHDDLPPTMSARIITAHVPDGLELARRHKLPKILQDGIAQHHGTSLVSYFYHLARDMSGEEVPQGLDRLFRYEGPKPQNRETAILHLADQVEAASRTIANREFDRMEAIVSRIIENSRSDGQLDECDLTFRDLALVKQAFLHSLSAVRHSRITYPTYDETPDSGAQRDELADPAEARSDRPQ
ncbi:MAG: HDIG domain-containing protein [Chthonomonas sp.]|nr:HDIG domain-containing protein [Chthonomonas sp.]